MVKTNKKPALGVLYAFGAFIIWGFAPLYWKQLLHISSLELLGHRIIWGVICLGIFLFSLKGKGFLDELKEHGDRTLLASSFLIFINWFLFIWAVNTNHILDASLGYYLTPIINILTGFVFFNEGMRPVKLIAIILASFGVGVLFFLKSGSPWISLSLASTFSVYGYLKKKSNVSAQSALFFEMSVWVIPVIIYFLYLEAQGSLAFLENDFSAFALLSLAGVITISPLWFFNNSVKHLDLGTVGFLQYLAPSLQLGVGILIYNESLTVERLISFAFIWVGIILYSADGLIGKKKNAA